MVSCMTNVHISSCPCMKVCFIDYECVFSFKCNLCYNYTFSPINNEFQWSSLIHNLTASSNRSLFMFLRAFFLDIIECQIRCIQRASEWLMFMRSKSISSLDSETMHRFTQLKCLMFRSDGCFWLFSSVREIGRSSQRSFCVRYRPTNFWFINFFWFWSTIY